MGNKDHRKQIINSSLGAILLVLSLQSLSSSLLPTHNENWVFKCEKKKKKSGLDVNPENKGRLNLAAWTNEKKILPAFQYVSFHPTN